MTAAFPNVVAILARILLSQLFLMAGVHHLTDWRGTIEIMSGKVWSMETPVGNVIDFLLAGAVAFLLLGGLSVLLGLWARFGAVLLMLFLIPVTLTMHDFWTYSATNQERMMQMGHFMSNTALLGGVLMVAAFGAGTLSIDALLAKRRPASS